VSNSRAAPDECSQCVCADLQIHAVATGTPLGKHLAALSATDVNPAPASMPLPLALQLPGRFRLAASVAALSGVDLPRLLPRACATPGHGVLVHLVADCARAQAAAQRAVATGDLPQARRVARWAVKRAVRGAGELVATGARAHSRDLYWCCKLAEEHLEGVLAGLAAQHPHAMSEHVAASISAAVRAFDGADNSDDAATRAAGAHTWHSHAASFSHGLWQLLEAYVAAPELSVGALVDTVHRATALAAALDAAALAKMSTAPADWRPAVPGLPARTGSPARPRQHAPLRAIGHALQETMLPLACHARRGRVHGCLDGAAAPQHRIPITRSITDFDCRCAEGHAAAAAHFDALASGPLGLTDCTDAAPVVLRGGAAARPAWGTWSIDALVRRAGGMRGSVRVAPSLAFPFVQPHVAAALRAIAVEAALPSTTRQVR
jgi:hypothetical protein